MIPIFLRKSRKVQNEESFYNLQKRGGNYCMSSNLGINPLVPATGFGPVMGFALIEGYPILAVICGVCCAIILAGMIYRHVRKKSYLTK